MIFNRRRTSDYTILDGPSTEQSVRNRVSEQTIQFEGGSTKTTQQGYASSTTEYRFLQEDSLLLRTKTGHEILTFAGPTIDALRYMATRLLVNDELPQRTAMVSAIREEGVTYNALALATLLAYDTSKRICYVDLNWSHPYIQLQAATIYNQGITALLQNRPDWNTTLVATNYPNLTLLPAGDLRPHQRAVTARSRTLVDLLDELADRFDHLVLDIPAILTTSDAIPLASLANAGCMVVRHGVSTSELVNKALADINHLPMLGVIMNRTSTQIPAWLLKWIPQE